MSEEFTELERKIIQKLQRTVIGAVGGLVGGFAIFLIIFGIDSQLSVTPGTFYKMVGIPVGLSDLSATIFGLVGHMLTAALIGAVFCFCSGLHQKLDIKSLRKGAFAGGVTAVAVYAIFFIPITLLVMDPALESQTTDEAGLVTTLANIDSKKLVENMNLILIGSLEMHIVYGIVMGTLCAMMLKKEFARIGTTLSNARALKIITIIIILATSAIASYYVLIPSYSQISLDQSTLSFELSKIQEGLTYSKFIELDRQEKLDLVAKMPGRTIDLMINEATKYDTVSSDEMDEIVSKVQSSNELKFIQIGEIQGLKGNNAEGKTYVIAAGDSIFLRFEKFSVTNGPDLHVFLTKSGDISTGFDVGPLKANKGDQNYEITGIDTNEYSIVIISSDTFGQYYASAKLVQISEK
ncbi:MAG: DM13 domain-containing protein [Nitrosopumilaceae archaeon]